MEKGSGEMREELCKARTGRWELGGERLWSRGETGKRKMIRVTYQRDQIPSRLDPEAAVPLHSGFGVQLVTFRLKCCIFRI